MAYTNHNMQYSLYCHQLHDYPIHETQQTIGLIQIIAHTLNTKCVILFVLTFRFAYSVCPFLHAALFTIFRLVP